MGMWFYSFLSISQPLNFSQKWEKPPAPWFTMMAQGFFQKWKKGRWTTFRQNCLKALSQKWLTAAGLQKTAGCKVLCTQLLQKTPVYTVQFSTPADGERLVRRFDSSEVSNVCSANWKTKGMSETFTPLLSNICSFETQKKNGSPPDQWEQEPPIFNIQSTFHP